MSNTSLLGSYGDNSGAGLMFRKSFGQFGPTYNISGGSQGQGWLLWFDWTSSAEL